MVTYVSGPMLAKPTPVHALEPSSLAAVATMRRMALEKRRNAEMAKIVTKVGRAPVRPYDADPVTSGAKSLARLAERAGFTVQVLVTHDACTVEGYRMAPHREGFRAHWKRGATKGASWHEPRRYEMIEDRRTVAMDAKNYVGKAGHRTAGMGVHRLSIASTPQGVPLGVTKLTERLKAIEAEVA